jgi:pimeloyl-ACP methyl ester carboxylesterase
MAKSVIATAYGKGPDRSYVVGCSNGGRHTLVAAARYGDQYDGFLAGDPGILLPKAAVANIAGAQGYATLASSTSDISTGFTLAERTLVSNAVLKQVRRARRRERRAGAGHRRLQDRRPRRA